jgi:uncharacterized membrane protein YccC
MRVLTLASIMVLCAAGGTSAQGLYDDSARLLAQQQMFEMAQRDSLFRQQELQAAQARADTEMRLSGLAQQRAASAAALYTPSIQTGARIDAQLGADTARIEQLTDAALARSNARVLAVKPVTQ